MAHDSHDPNASDEPKTPMWLPALGALLFLVAGIYWATRPAEPVASTGGDDGGIAADAGDAGADAAAAAPTHPAGE